MKYRKKGWGTRPASRTVSYVVVDGRVESYNGNTRTELQDNSKLKSPLFPWNKRKAKSS